MASKGNPEVEGESNLHQPTKSNEPVRIGIRKKGKYQREDLVDSYLLNQIAKYIKHDELGVLARDLNIDKNVYVNIATQKDQIWEVLNSWKDALPDDYTVNDFVAEIQDWYDEGYLHDEIWKRLKKCVVPSVLEPLHKETLETMSNVKLEVTTTQGAHHSRTDTSSMEIIHSRDALLDEHILELSKRISNGNELVDLGVEVLHLPDYKINTALYDHNDSIQAATHELLSFWVKRQTSRKEAYTNLYSSLRKAQMGELAWLLKKWVEGIEEEAVDEIQRVLKDTLYKTWKESMPNEWLSPTLARSEKLIQCYVEPKMTWKPGLGEQGIKLPLNRFQDIFNYLGAGTKRILAKAARGMGKTSVVSHLAFTWINSPESILKKFDFLFMIALEQVKETSSLAELVRAKLGLSRASQPRLQSILEGKTSHKVLLILDGYDKYKPGTNKDIDMIVDMGLKSGTVIITCCYGNYLPTKVYDQMDAVVDINGFAGPQIDKWAALYLGSKARMKDMLSKYTELIDHSKALDRPIFLLMACVIYTEKNLSIATETELLCTVQEMILTRAIEEHSTFLPSERKDLETWLSILGDISWKSLQKDVGQHLLVKEEIKLKCPQLLHLGLFKNLGNRVMFHCQSLQELLAAKHITRRLETSQDEKKALNELFSSYYDALENEDIVALVVGLSKDPRLIVQHIHQIHLQMWIDDFRFGNIDRERVAQLEDRNKLLSMVTLFISLYGESTMQLPGCWKRNEHWNTFGEKDDWYKTWKGPSRVYFPSKLYMFSIQPGDEVPCEIEQHEGCAEIPDCTMVIIVHPVDSSVTKKVLTLCRKISEKQAIVDFSMTCNGCGDLTKAEVPKLSKNVQSVRLFTSELPANFIREVFSQLFDCSSLKTLDLHGIDLHEVETNLDELLENISVTCLKQDKTLRFVVTKSLVSQMFCAKWSWRREETGVLFIVKGTNPIDGGEKVKSEDLTLDEIKWSIEEQENRQDDFAKTPNSQCFPSKNDDNEGRRSDVSLEEKYEKYEDRYIPSDTQTEMQDPASLGLRCSLIDNIHETQRNEELSLEEINWLIQEQELNLKDSKIETVKGGETEDKPSDGTLTKRKVEDELRHEILKKKKTEGQSSDETLKKKKTGDQPPDGTLKDRKTEAQRPEATLKDKKTEDQPPDGTLKDKKTEDQPPDGTLKDKKAEYQPPDGTLKDKKTEDQPPDGTLKDRKTEAQSADESLTKKKTEGQSMKI